jgi:hypothetical protein
MGGRGGNLVEWVRGLGFMGGCMGDLVEGGEDWVSRVWLVVVKFGREGGENWDSFVWL